MVWSICGRERSPATDLGLRHGGQQAAVVVRALQAGVRQRQRGEAVPQRGERGAREQRVAVGALPAPHHARRHHLADAVEYVLRKHHHNL